MAIISSSNFNYMMRSFYSSNRMAYKSYNRGTLKNHDLIRADSEAMRKVTKNLKELEYNTDNGAAIYNNVKAFVETYNNLLESTDKASTSREMSRAQKALKSYMKEHKDDLEDIGIKLSSSGKLELKKTTLATSTPSKVAKVLRDKDNLIGNVSKHATRIVRIARNMGLNGNSASKKTTTTETTTPPVTTAFDIVSQFDSMA